MPRPGLLGLWPKLMRKGENANSQTWLLLFLVRAFSAHVLHCKQKKERECWWLFFYAAFSLLTGASSAPTIAMAMIMAMIPGSRYVSAADCCSACVCAGVGAAGSTTKDVVACDGQQDSLPANERRLCICPRFLASSWSEIESFFCLEFLAKLLWSHHFAFKIWQPFKMFLILS